MDASESILTWLWHSARRAWREQGLPGTAMAPLNDHVDAVLGSTLAQQFDAQLAQIPPFAGDWHCDTPGRVVIAAEQHGDAALRSALLDLRPWRKGPWRVAGIDINAEWRSDYKWQRIISAVGGERLHSARVLDVGCGNGYYLQRICEHAPRLALGVEPYLRNVAQYAALRRHMHAPCGELIPLRMEDLPPTPQAWDVICYLGVLAHRRAPWDALRDCRERLCPGGLLVLETLVIPGDGDIALVPRDRYAQMRNVYLVPTVDCLIGQLQRCGFQEVRCVDVSPTTTAEQAGGEWVQTRSLPDFLDPDDPERSIEGYPAPRRAVVLAEAPAGR